jgi:hypothetical protein
MAFLYGYSQESDTTKKSSKFKTWYNAQLGDGLSIDKKPDKKWYENFAVKGYVQFRYNRLVQTNSDLKCEQCDKDWGGTGGFGFRRVRMSFAGEIGQRVYFSIQPDFVSGSQVVVQLKDVFFDIGIGKHNEIRFRIGQSKIPFGMENMQSSQIRLSFDRTDGLNSAGNERDLGVFFYWAPKKMREHFANALKTGLKGYGDFGLIAFGVYYGQGAAKPELNKPPHVVLRATYPFFAGSQVIEPSIQAYSGKYVVDGSQAKAVKNRTYIDQRIAASFMLYPKPFGIMAEYNFGRGPEFNPHSDSIEVQKLHGGYILFNYLIPIKKHLMYPYCRLQYYNGGKKFEQDARSYTVKELETGIEYQPFKQFEITLAYIYSQRRFEDHILPNNFQKGHLLRIQLQASF